MYPGFSTRLHHDVTQSYVREVLKGDKKRLGSVRSSRMASPVVCRVPPPRLARVQAHHPSLVALVHAPTPTQSPFKLRIEDPPRRKHMVFMGASLYANLMSQRDDFWMNRSEYEEEGGARLVARKLGRLIN